MANIRLFFGSTTGHTDHVADLIKREMGDALTSVTDIHEASAEDLESADALILGIPTWNEGELQDDWEAFLPQMDHLDLSGKKVALFGLGDAAAYTDEFADGLGTLYQKVKQCGAEVVGPWPIDDYEFLDSKAVESGHFVGLVIDEDNQPEMTERRVHDWVEMIQPVLAG
ncbi:MAG: flavodoxin [Thermoguttaceae bacterium]